MDTLFFLFFFYKRYVVCRSCLVRKRWRVKKNKQRNLFEMNNKISHNMQSSVYYVQKRKNTVINFNLWYDRCVTTISQFVGNASGQVRGRGLKKITPGFGWESSCFVTKYIYIHRRWGDKTLYLKNVKCSGEPKNMAAIMNGTAFFLPCHSGFIFSDWNLQFGQDKI